MSLNKQQLAIIHIAKKDRGFSDDSYRSALAQICGVTSSAELDHDGFLAMMGFFDFCGFKPADAKGANFGPRPGMASFAQIELIRVLWSEYTHRAYGGEGELNKWLLRTFKLSSLRFVTKDTARKVITALKVMKSRAA
jgi:hypothetical protein